MEFEIWKPIPYFDDYEISSFGRVRSHKFRECRILVQKKSKKTGYMSIGLCRENKRTFFLIHRLVLSVFSPIANMDNLQVNHKDENRQNNNISNLEWVTAKQNCNYGNRNEKIRSMANKKRIRCVETGEIFESLADAHRKTGTCLSSLCRHLKGHPSNKIANNLHWEEIYE